MVHLASPLPVFVAVHPGGAAPGVASSKLAVSAKAEAVIREVITISVLSVFMVSLFSVGSFHGFLRVEGVLEAAGQRFRFAFAPIVQKQETRVLVRHVVMDGDDVDGFLPQ